MIRPSSRLFPAVRIGLGDQAVVSMAHIANPPPIMTAGSRRYAAVTAGAGTFSAARAVPAPINASSIAPFSVVPPPPMAFTPGTSGMNANMRKNEQIIIIIFVRAGGRTPMRPAGYRRYAIGLPR